VASLADAIPVELQSPAQKDAVIAWIKSTKVPYRFRRQMLHDWGELVGVHLDAADYKVLTDWDDRASLARQRT
jgi:hypothetical protein